MTLEWPPFKFETKLGDRRALIRFTADEDTLWDLYIHRVEPFLATLKRVPEQPAPVV